MLLSTKKIIAAAFVSIACSFSASAINDALKVQIINGTITDEAVVRFLPTATSGFDGSFDAYKMFSVAPTVPSVFTNIDPVTHLSINALPATTDRVDVDLYTYIKVAGTYTLNPIELGSGFEAGVGIVLEDKQTGINYNFRNGNAVSISLSVSSMSDASRFTLHFTPANFYARARTPVPAVTFSNNGDNGAFVNGARVSFINNTAVTDRCSWDFGDGENGTSTSVTHEYAATGVYTVTLTTTNAAGETASLSKIITVNADEAAKDLTTENAEMNNLAAYPQDGELVLNFQSAEAAAIFISVYNTMGQLIWSYSGNRPDLSERVALPASGNYIVNSIINNHVQSQKLNFTK